MLKYPKAKQNAVSNFLLSCPAEGALAESNAQANLRMDAKMYKWNADTVTAIQKGLRELFL